MMTEEEILARLKAPFPVNKLHWRIGQKSNWDYKTRQPKDPKKEVSALMLVYIDSRDVQDRLDEVCGNNWSNSYSEVMNRLVCTININGNCRSDGAGDTDFEAEKGGLSDAFKRSAVMWGVGRYLYEASKYDTWVDASNKSDSSLYKTNKEKLDAVACALGRNLILLPLFMKKIKDCKDIDSLEEVKKSASLKARDERWSKEENEKFVKAYQDKKKEIEEQNHE